MGIKDFFKSPGKQAIEGVISGAADVVDRFVHTKQEQAELKAELEKEITQRWKADAMSDSWLSKNIRPLVLVWFIVNLTLLMWFDGNVGEFTLGAEWKPLLTQIGLTVLGGYFILREGGKLVNKAFK